MAHVLKVRGWRCMSLTSLSELLSELFPASTLDAGSRSLATRQLASRFRRVQKVWGDLVRWWCRSPHEGPGNQGSYPLPEEVPGSSDELVAAPVMMAASRLGTLAVWRRVAFLAMAGRLMRVAHQDLNFLLHPH